MRWASLLLAAVASVGRANPWLMPGDETVRSDIQMLADAGVLKGPVTTWPISMPEIARDLAGAPQDLDPAAQAALARVQRAARLASNYGYTGVELQASLARHPQALRGFGDSPREEAEARAEAGWLGNRFAANARVTVVAEAGDGQDVRFDGSYMGVSIANFMISAGFVERWWGPGWDGSLILSNNARPIPGITVERNYADPFKSRPLSWLGLWRASIAIGQAEGSGVAVADVRFLAARLNFKPRPWLEFGLSRTAQWCGEGRVCNWATFTDLLIGRDNRADESAIDTEPGNQMAGYDLRVRSPWRRLPLVAYTQWIGEDEAGSLPSKFLGLGGIETWTSIPLGSLRLRAEYADTTCMFTREEPNFSCAYRNGLFPQGYAYRGRIIGHAMDNDSRMRSVAALLVRPAGDSISLLVRRVDLNRDGGPHAISDVQRNLDNVELRYSRSFKLSHLTVGAGLDDRDGATGRGPQVRGFLTFRQGF